MIFIYGSLEVMLFRQLLTPRYRARSNIPPPSLSKNEQVPEDVCVVGVCASFSAPACLLFFFFSSERAPLPPPPALHNMWVR